MRLVRLAQVHDGQHHENVCLQGHHQDMEHRPAKVQRQLINPSSAIRINISSPAYMLPNSRSDSDSGFASNATASSIKLNAITSGHSNLGTPRSFGG